jgi:hypothetical protein
MGVELLDYGATGAASARLTGYVVYAALMAAITFWQLGGTGEKDEAASTTTWLEPAAAQV